EVAIRERTDAVELLLREAFFVKPREFTHRETDREMRRLGPKRTQPDREVLLAARIVHERKARPAFLGEMLDVGVVAVVEAALTANRLHQPSDELSVLAEPRAGEDERRII